MRRKTSLINHIEEKQGLRVIGLLGSSKSIKDYPSDQLLSGQVDNCFFCTFEGGGNLGSS